MAEPWRDKIDETFAFLRKEGIGAIITLTEDNPYGERFIAAGFRRLHEPIEDNQPPSTEAMDRIIAFIDSSLADNIAVAVHCWEGRGRTGTILGTWLGHKLGLNGEEAIENIYKLRFQTIITWPQRKFMIKYLEKNDEL
jgi:atypical dual specificity phosphatase